MTQCHLLAVTKLLHPAVSSEHRSRHLTATCCLPGVSSGPLSSHTQLPHPFATAVPSPHLDIVPKHSLMPKHLTAWKSQWTPSCEPWQPGIQPPTQPPCAYRCAFQPRNHKGKCPALGSARTLSFLPYNYQSPSAQQDCTFQRKRDLSIPSLCFC